jgi:hypothetical protein
MRPADELPPERLIGKRIAFKDDSEHAGCWHHQVGLRTGKVLRVGQSLAKKAELLQAEGIVLPDAMPEECDVVRLWVFTDPCPAFPRGCETAVEQGCLLLLDGGERGT